MKKSFALLLALTLLLTLAACGGSNGNSTSDNDRDVTAQQPAATAPEDADKSDRGDDTKPTEGEQTATQQPADSEQTQPEQPAESDEAKPVVLSASHSDVTLTFVGHSFRLTAKGFGTDAVVTYTSQDPAVAAVAEDGTVTAAARGTTQILMHVEQDGEAYDYTCVVRCNWEDAPNSEPAGETAPSGEGEKSVDLAQCVEDILNGLGEGNVPAMVDAAAETEYVDSFFPGLSGYELKQCVLQMAAMSQVGFELDMVECANADDVAAVKAILQARKDSQVDGGAWYPAVIEVWEQGQVLVKGNVVALIVAGENQADAVATFNALFD